MIYNVGLHTCRLYKLHAHAHGVSHWVDTRAGDWVGYPIYNCKTQSLGGSFTMHDPNLWAQLNYASTQTQWAWVH